MKGQGIHPAVWKKDHMLQCKRKGVKKPGSKTQKINCSSLNFYLRGEWMVLNKDELPGIGFYLKKSFREGQKDERRLQIKSPRRRPAKYRKK